MDPHELIGLVPHELFQAIFEDSPRNMRRAVIGVASGKKKKKKKRSLKSQLAAKQAEQAAALRAAQDRLADPELNEFAEEILRNFLAKTPEMLTAFLDFMEVPHQDGYTDDLDFVEQMTLQQASAATNLLAQQFPIDRVTLYLVYLGVKDITDVDKIRAQLLAWGWDPDAAADDEDEDDAGGAGVDADDDDADADDADADDADADDDEPKPTE